MVRTIIAAVVATVVAMATFLIVEQTGHTLYPAATTVNWSDAAAAKAYMDAMPVWAHLFIWGGWLVGSVLAGFVAGKISHYRGLVLPLALGAILTLSAVANFVMIPHPVWFVVLGLVTFIPAVFGGWMLSTSTQGLRGAAQGA